MCDEIVNATDSVSTNVLNTTLIQTEPIFLISCGSKLKLYSDK